MGPGGSAHASGPRKYTESSVVLDQSRPTSFFLANEGMVARSGSSELGVDSTFGVRSLQETTDSVADTDTEKHGTEAAGVDDENSEGARRRSTLKPSTKSRETSTQHPDLASSTSTVDSSPRKLPRRFSPPSASHSLTSLSQASQDLGLSSPGSPKSISNRSSRPSDEESMDEGGSQAIASSEDEAEVSPEGGDSAPQLIMPSIKMPSRRPFTTHGKDIGRLKILIAGDTGIGKTSVIKSIVQTCEDIVHVDPLSSSSPSTERPSTRRGKGRDESTAARGTDRISEVYASTRAYPSWWSDFEEHRLLRRRKGLDDTVLERNLCFVDTPGYSGRTSETEGMDLILQYIESQLAKTFSFGDITESELVSMLAGDGGAQVDLVLYLMHRSPNATDLDFLGRLSALTNVIPLLSKVDLLSEDDIKASKSDISAALESVGIRPFSFNSGVSDLPPLYTVCSALSKDEETMDASLLMSPDYVQPLLSSDLSTLVRRIFDKENISHLRHLAAMKLVRHRPNPSTLPLSLLPPSSPFNIPHHQNLASPLSSSFPTLPSAAQTLTHHTGNPSSSYLQARIADHTLREQRLAQARLARWATNLQRGLHNERTRYEALAQGERAVWLTQRLGECVNEGSLVPAASSSSTVEQLLRQRGIGKNNIDVCDPLGLVKWSEMVRSRGWVVLEVVGGFGLLGAVAMWVARGWEWEGEWWGWWAGR